MMNVYAQEYGLVETNMMAWHNTYSVILKYNTGIPNIPESTASPPHTDIHAHCKNRIFHCE